MEISRPSYLIRTGRLGLRTWSESDMKPFARMNADPVVMEHFPKLLSKKESREAAYRFYHHIQQRGYGFYAVDRLDTGEFIGFVGMQYVDFRAEFTPCTEIGWRLVPAAWGRGYATEAARACLQQAFTRLDLPAVWSFTPHTNRLSERVMQRIGLRRVGSFQHPGLADEHPLQPLLLYRITREEWQQSFGP